MGSSPSSCHEPRVVVSQPGDAALRPSQHSVRRLAGRGRTESQRVRSVQSLSDSDRNNSPQGRLWGTAPALFRPDRPDTPLVGRSRSEQIANSQDVNAQRRPFNPLADEQLLVHHRLPLVQAFVRANGIEEVHIYATNRALGIVAAKHGKTPSHTARIASRR